MQGCQLDKLQACVPRLLKDDKALPVVWLNFWINCFVTGLQQKEKSLTQSVFLAEVECLLTSTGISGAGGCIAGYQHGHRGLKNWEKNIGKQFLTWSGECFQASFRSLPINRWHFQSHTKSLDSGFFVIWSSKIHYSKRCSFFFYSFFLYYFFNTTFCSPKEKKISLILF